MICYRDRTYCGSKVRKHTCGREFIPDENYWKWSKELGVPKGGPVAFSKFCSPKKPKEANQDDI